MIKEVKQETNLDISVGKLVYSENHNVNGVEVLIVIFNSSIVSNRNVELIFEHVEYNFFTKDELQVMNVPKWIKKLFN